MSIEQCLTVYFESVSDVSAFFSDISPVSRLIRNKDLALPSPTISYSILLSGNYKRRLEFSIIKLAILNLLSTKCTEVHYA